MGRSIAFFPPLLEYNKILNTCINRSFLSILHRSPFCISQIKQGLHDQETLPTPTHFEVIADGKIEIECRDNSKFQPFEQKQNAEDRFIKIALTFAADKLSRKGWTFVTLMFNNLG